MSTLSPAAVIRNAKAETFLRVEDLPGTPAAARKAASRAAESGELLPIRRGVYYKGKRTKYGVTSPRPDEVVRVVLGTKGVGPAGYSAARLWGVTTQVPAKLHVAACKVPEPIRGVHVHSRANLERTSLNEREIALLELLRAPDTYVEAGWPVLMSKVHDAVTAREVRPAKMKAAVRQERNAAASAAFRRLTDEAWWPAA